MQQGLTCELVPRTAWWSNVRSNVSKADWEKCKDYAKAKTLAGTALAHCIICGQNGVDQGYRYPVEAHEIWDYDDVRDIQTLVDIWPLCPLCHQVKHLGRLRSENDPARWARAIDHLKAVNDWPDWKVEKYVSLQFEIWEIRSTHSWALDITFLANVVGLEIGQAFFPAKVRA